MRSMSNMGSGKPSSMGNSGGALRGRNRAMSRAPADRAHGLRGSKPMFSERRPMFEGRPERPMFGEGNAFGDRFDPGMGDRFAEMQAFRNAMGDWREARPEPGGGAIRDWMGERPEAPDWRQVVAERLQQVDPQRRWRGLGGY